MTALQSLERSVASAKIRHFGPMSNVIARKIKVMERRESRQIATKSWDAKSLSQPPFSAPLPRCIIQSQRQVVIPSSFSNDHARSGSSHDDGHCAMLAQSGLIQAKVYKPHSVLSRQQSSRGLSWAQLSAYDPFTKLGTGDSFESPARSLARSGDYSVLQRTPQWHGRSSMQSVFNWPDYLIFQPLFWLHSDRLSTPTTQIISKRDYWVM